jgi:Transposase DDE domain
MSSLNIVQDSRTLIQNKLLPAVTTKWWPQLGFGLEAFSLRPYRSASSNARSVVGNANTASSKARRLLANEQLASSLGTVSDQLQLVRTSSFVNVDHSDFDGLTALVGAVQTRRGRAIPVMVETTYAHHIPAAGSRLSTPRWQRLRDAMVAARQAQSFTDHTVSALQSLHDRLGFWPQLVFDRGFGNVITIRHLVEQDATFYIRLKAGRMVELDGQKLSIRALAANDATVELSGMTLRVICSPKSRRAPEPWYILTNDRTSSRTRIVRVYYHRFEIEETFKDTKHLFELHHLSFLRPTSLKMVLWLVFLGIAILYVVTILAQRYNQQIVHPKKRRSWVRIAYEQLQRELTSYRALTGLAPRPEVRG